MCFGIAIDKQILGGGGPLTDLFSFLLGELHCLLGYSSPLQNSFGPLLSSGGPFQDVCALLQDGGDPFEGSGLLEGSYDARDKK
jgi:hypothetical protein